jgi:hypothetical protein
MQVPKKNFNDFYNEIREQFPKMKQLDTWDKYDWSSDGYENSMIMSELSYEMGTWVDEGHIGDGQSMMDLIERYFHEGNMAVTSIIYSDFLVTIMEMKRNVREMIKKMMGPQTEMHYHNLLNLYRELDT